MWNAIFFKSDPNHIWRWFEMWFKSDFYKCVSVQTLLKLISDFKMYFLSLHNKSREMEAHQNGSEQSGEEDNTERHSIKINCLLCGWIAWLFAEWGGGSIFLRIQRWKATSLAYVATVAYAVATATNDDELVTPGHKNQTYSLTNYSGDAPSFRSDLGNKSDLPADWTRPWRRLSHWCHLSLSNLNLNLLVECFFMDCCAYYLRQGGCAFTCVCLLVGWFGTLSRIDPLRCESGECGGVHTLQSLGWGT